MKIAGFVDGEGTITSPYGECRLRLCENGTGAWTPVRDVAFAIRSDMSLAEVKTVVREAARQLEDCRIVVSAEARGLVPVVFQEELGFHTWKSQGALQDQLDGIAAREAELAKASAPQPPLEMGAGCRGGCGGGRRQKAFDPAPAVPLSSLERTGESRYRIDLVDTLKRDPDLNSRMVLLPLLEAGAFDELEILCDHVPRWFSGAIEAMPLRAECQAAERGVRVLVFPES
ncbi:Fe-only nitrogenase accessory protein AnfO [Solidesulfovibrio sp.]|uniref:Fe-only nitrogenase accessory protein AnfO n=1 Tax=Solidesulfovibrio sp. TaxID=2910990 RepID=UPI002602FDA7|nr:Fe-only nitrogenase accessory protein AnfO [Solidesulfovibrio sp.]